MNNGKRLVFGLILVATSLVLLSGVASAAKFASTATPEVISGFGGTQVLTASTAAVKCTEINNKSAFIAFPAEQLIMTAELSNCKVEGLGTAKATCASFNFHSTGTVFGSIDNEGTITLGECKIEVVGGICKVIVPSQLVGGAIGSHVTYTNSIGIINTVLNVSGIKYTASAGCIGFEKEGKTGTYKGELALRGAAGAKIAVV